MSSAIYPDPPRLVFAVCGHGEQQRLSNARLRLTFYNAPVAYCGPARPGSAFQQSAVSGLLPRARARREIPLPSTARIAGYDCIFGDRLHRGVILVEGGKAEEVAGQQQLHNLAPTIGLHHASPRRARSHAIPIFGRLPLTADFLSPMALPDGRDRCELIQPLWF